LTVTVGFCGWDSSKPWCSSLNNYQKGIPMKTTRNIAVNVSIAVLLLGLGGCAGMTEQEKGTAIGAGAGAIGGAVLGGGTLGTLGGAAVGGVIGHEVTKPKK
jgi:osmotically inducible lipoprotein OsmB